MEGCSVGLGLRHCVLVILRRDLDLARRLVRSGFASGISLSTSVERMDLCRISLRIPAMPCLLPTVLRMPVLFRWVLLHSRPHSSPEFATLTCKVAGNSETPPL
jgi:hypothetical protein